MLTFNTGSVLRLHNVFRKVFLNTVGKRHQTLIKRKVLHPAPEEISNTLGDSHVCRLQMMYPLLVLCSAGSDNSETAGELSRRQSPWQFGGASGDRRRCTDSSKSDLWPSFNPSHLSRVLKANIKAVESRRGKSSEKILNMLRLGKIYLCFGIIDAQVSKKLKLVRNSDRSAVREEGFVFWWQL